MNKNKISKDDLFLEIREIYNKIGKMNTVIFKENQKITETNSSCDYILHKFGGLVNICNELNIPFTNAHKFDSNMILEDIKRVYLINNHISSKLYEEQGNYSISAVKNNLGGFNIALEKLNLPINMHKNVTKEQIIDDVNNFYNKYKTTVCGHYRKYGKYSECTINRLFGSWKNLMEAMQLPYVGETYGYKEIVRQISNVYNKYGFISKELVNSECDFSYQALSYYFKTKQDISAAIGVDNCFLENGSQKVIIIKRILFLLYGENNISIEKTWEWLINDQTNKHMYVDFYIQFINMVIEFDGKQHEQYSEFMHKSLENYEKSVYRDQLKEKLVKEHNIKIIRIPYDFTITIESINKLIINKLLNEDKYAEFT